MVRSTGMTKAGVGDALDGWLTSLDHRLKRLERVDRGEKPTGWLAIDPAENYMGGQGLHWFGNIGALGVRPITMQRYLGRPGDDWEDVKDFGVESDSEGN